MMLKTVPATLSLTLALLVGGAHGQTIAEERQKIQQYSQTISALQSSNADIERKITDLSQQIEASQDKYTPEKKARNKAEATYQDAIKLAEDKPSAANLEKAEAARFSFLMAERKYERSSQDVRKQEKRLQNLQAKLDSNANKIRNNQARIAQQQKQILAVEQQARQQASKQAQSERELRLQREGALRSSHNELSKTRQAHAAAVEEIALLKAQLAAKEATLKLEAEAKAAAAASAVTVAKLSSPTTTDASPTKHDTDPVAKNTAAEQAETLLSDPLIYSHLMTVTTNPGKKGRVNKILHMKTYKQDRLSKQTSHSLKHLGNGIYEGRTHIRAGETAFVIGSKQWRKTVPGTQSRKEIIFILDARNKSKPELLLFSNSVKL